MTTLELAALPPVRAGVCADPDWMASFAQHIESARLRVHRGRRAPARHRRTTRAATPTPPSGRMPLPDDCAIPDPIDLLAFLAGVTTDTGARHRRRGPSRPSSRGHGQAPGHGGPAVEGSGAVVHRGGLDARGARGVRGRLRHPGAADRRVHRRAARPVGRYRAPRGDLRGRVLPLLPRPHPSQALRGRRRAHPHRGAQPGVHQAGGAARRRLAATGAVGRRARRRAGPPGPRDREVGPRPRWSSS